MTEILLCRARVQDIVRTIAVVSGSGEVKVNRADFQFALFLVLLMFHDEFVINETGGEGYDRIIHFDNPVLVPNCVYNKKAAGRLEKSRIHQIKICRGGFGLRDFYFLGLLWFLERSDIKRRERRVLLWN